MSSAKAQTSFNPNAIPIAGTLNVGIGQYLTSNTNGTRNTAVGKQTLNKNTTGEGNTATGTDALAFNTTGMENTAIGNRVLRQNGQGEFQYG